MKEYTFNFEDKTYVLKEENCSELFNDEERPVSGIEVSDVLELLDQQQTIDFDVSYYKRPCQVCLAKREEEEEYFRFLEYYFYIFSKDGKYVMSNLSEEYKEMSVNKLFKKGKIDASYVVTIIVCIECGDYSIQIEQCDI